MQVLKSGYLTLPAPEQTCADWRTAGVSHYRSWYKSARSHCSQRFQSQQCPGNQCNEPFSWLGQKVCCYTCQQWNGRQAHRSYGQYRRQSWQHQCKFDPLRPILCQPSTWAKNMKNKKLFVILNKKKNEWAKQTNELSVVYAMNFHKKNYHLCK